MTRARSRPYPAMRGEVPLKNLYTSGLATQQFFRALKEREEILASTCARCELSYVPCRFFCERCFENISGSSHAVQPEGRLVAWTEVRRDFNGGRLSKPVLVGAVKLSGASTVLIHYLKVPPKAVSQGMRVRAQFRPPKKRTGSILDIEGFVAP